MPIDPKKNVESVFGLSSRPVEVVEPTGAIATEEVVSKAYDSVFVAPQENIATYPTVESIDIPLRTSEFTSKNYNKKLSRRNVVAAGIAALAIAAAGVAGGVVSLQSHQTTAGTNASPNFNNNGMPSSSLPSQEQPNPLQQTEAPKPIDYELDPVNFGSANKGCRSLGTYALNAMLIPFTDNGYSYVVHAPAVKVGLMTCGPDIKRIIRDDGVDEATNTVKKVILINEGSLTRHAVLPKASVPTITHVTEAQKLVNKGYADIVNGVKLTTNEQKLKYICNSIAVEGCKTTAHLSAAKAAQVIATVEILQLQAIAPCEAVENTNELASIDKAYVLQLQNKGIDPKLTTRKFVDAKGNDPKTEPDYTKGLIAALAKKGGLTKASSQRKLFGDQQLIFTPTCTPDKVVAG